MAAESAGAVHAMPTAKNKMIAAFIVLNYDVYVESCAVLLQLERVRSNYNLDQTGAQGCSVLTRPRKLLMGN